MSTVLRFLCILLAILAFVLFVLVLVQGEEALDLLKRWDAPAIEIKVLAVVLAGWAALLALLLRQRFAQALRAVLFWLGIALLLALGYTYRFELRDVGDRVLAEFLPGYAAGRGRNVEIARGRGGSFAVTTRVNGARVAMVLDTGASAVVLTHDAAKAAGLPLEVLAYSVQVDTANGRTRAAPVTLDRIAVGGIVERAVPALIAQPGQLRVSLLGMSFLNRLERWEVRGDRLSLRGYP
jgi:aspartyl protease family protein